MTAPAGQLRPLGRLVDASNATFLMVDEANQRWVYKPVAGEAPLRDFPSGTLGRREVAAYALSEALGLGVVPLTLWHEGPFGEGSVQLWVDGKETDAVALVSPEQLDEQWLPVFLAEGPEGAPIVLAHRDDAQLRRIALFDALLNSADRKAGHLVFDGEQLFGVDHGLSLHVAHKLRTVLWGWAGTALSESERLIVARCAGLEAAPAPGLAAEEWEALGSVRPSCSAGAVSPRHWAIGATSPGRRGKPLRLIEPGTKCPCRNP